MIVCDHCFSDRIVFGAPAFCPSGWLFPGGAPEAITGLALTAMYYENDL